METPADLEMIRLLADGRFHSGAALGEMLGISRAAIWKRMQRLAEFGIEVESVRGKGYRLPRPLDLIEPDKVRDALAGRAALQFKPVTGSTNTDAMTRAASGVVSPLVITTECQSDGRGRRGRQWRSPFGANLYVSVLYQLSGGFSSLGGLSLAAGVAVSQVLGELAPDLDLGLKWPNDLYVNGAKLGGVLIELAGEMEGRVQVVVGVGINVAMPASQAAAIDQAWTDLEQACAVRPSRTVLTVAVARALLDMLERFSQEGFAPFMAAFQQRDLCRDQPVSVQAHGDSRAGIARGVKEDGALCVEIDGERHYVHGGEVSLRLQ